MRISIDAIHENSARVDFGGTMIDIPVEALPEGAKEGDIIAFMRIDPTQVLKDGYDRIHRMLNTSSSKAGDDFDI